MSVLPGATSRVSPWGRGTGRPPGPEGPQGFNPRQAPVPDVETVDTSTGPTGRVRHRSRCG
jgi:hypothetical protein